MFKRGLVTPYELKSIKLERTVRLGVYLPDAYSALNDHAVIIAFDGQDFSQLGQLHRQYERLYSTGDIRPALIIFVHYPDIVTRTKEYHPDSPAADSMKQFVTVELEDWLRDHFAVSDERLLMGDSLAASISLSIALRDSRFSQAALFSPMVTAAIFEALAVLQHPVRLYQLVGKEEISFKLMNGETADFLSPNRQLRKALESHGIDSEYRELDGGHTWKAWKPEIASALKYFLRE
ncbi:alpha/beta hydrolase [Macrococcus carouselicus]|uniref:Esterase family protein n=1 Tax=Macrococcus carouselicus TaxID=69969 RepID=A0A9Q8CN73_9STAP|nr:alpha/beta hydrolase-fold protein [Macrococcus carouselicus]TDM03810.1 esterase family protein [Macrococcus carouselicus]